MIAENSVLPASDEAKLVQQLKLLYEHLVTNHEAENKEISSYLHDTVIQILSAIHIQLSMLTLEYPEIEHNRLSDAMALIAELAENILQTARRLRPLELGTLDLNDILHQESKELSKGMGVPVAYEGEEFGNLPETTAVAFYRLLKEQFASIQQQAQATQVSVILANDSDSIRLTIQDNGASFGHNGQVVDEGHVPSLGLLGMMLRFRQLNGRLTITATEGDGTAMVATLPYSKVASDND